MRGVAMAVAVVALAFGMSLVSFGSASPSPPASDPFAWAPHPESTVEYGENVDAWVAYYLESSGEANVPEDTRQSIEFFARYSAPANTYRGVAPLDNTMPYGVHAGYMYLECSIVNPACFVEDWWGNMNSSCNAWDVPGIPGYTQTDARMTMAEWGIGFVNTWTEDEYGVHYWSNINGAILNGYLCKGQVSNRIVAVFSGWGLFDQEFIVDPAPVPWQAVPVQVGPPPPPYDNLGPPFCPSPDGVVFCWEPEDLTPEPPARQAKLGR